MSNDDACAPSNSASSQVFHSADEFICHGQQSTSAGSAELDPNSAGLRESVHHPQHAHAPLDDRRATKLYPYNRRFIAQNSRCTKTSHRLASPKALVQAPKPQTSPNPSLNRRPTPSTGQVKIHHNAFVPGYLEWEPLGASESLLH
jgi:hypothetical protein